MRTQISHLAGNLRLVHPRRAEVEQRARQLGDAGLALGFTSRTGSEIDLNVKDRQRVILDKEHARAGSRLPELDLRAGLGQLRGQGEKHAHQQLARIHHQALNQ